MVLVIMMNLGWRKNAQLLDKVLCMNNQSWRNKIMNKWFKDVNKIIMFFSQQDQIKMCKYQNH